jgi:hypothetical protein
MLNIKIAIDLPVNARHTNDDVCMRLVTVTMQMPVRSVKREVNVSFAGSNEKEMFESALGWLRNSLGAIMDQQYGK